MPFLHNLAKGIRGLFRKDKSESEIDEEVRGYLEASAAAKVKSGMSRTDAMRAARLEMGSVEGVKESVRSAGWEFFVETTWADVRFAARTLAKNPGFTAIAVLTLAIGIGANSAVFSVVNSVLLESMPYRAENRLVMVWEHNFRRGTDHNVVGPANFLYWKEHNNVFDQMAAFFDDTSTLTGEGEPEQIPSQGISTNLFSVLGISPILGRDFTSDEGAHGQNHVVLLGYGLWKRRFGGDTSIVGTSIKLDGVNYLVVGVMPPNVTLFAPKGSLTGKVAQLWWPYGWGDRDRHFGGRWMSAVARLKPGVSVAQAQAQMDEFAAEVTKAYPEFETGWGVNLVPMHQDMVSGMRPTLLVLLGAVGFVLLITCANVANLLLSRAASRERELALRSALGASRWRITRQSFTESILLAVFGGVLGILAARWVVSALVLLIPKEFHVQSVSLDWRIVLFTAGISVMTGILFGIAPALDARRTNLSDVLREGGRSETGTRGRRLRDAFAVAEIALSLVLLAGAGLLIRSFVRLSSVDAGFNAANILTTRITLPSAKYAGDPQWVGFFQQLLEQVRALPGVRAATISNAFPLTGMTPGTDFDIVGKPLAPAGEGYVTDVQLVGSDYFRTMGVPLLRGRVFTDREETVPSNVVIISQTLAQQFFRGEDPIGQKIIIHMKKEDKPSEIIGIAADVKRDTLDKSSIAMSYWPHGELAFSSMVLAVRTDSDPLAKLSAVQQIVHRMDPELPLEDVGTMEKWIGDAVARQRFSALLVGVFAAIAVLLAAIGIYGVVAYAVGLRTREFGIRMALGAERSDVLWLVFRHGAVLAALGVFFGVAGTLALTRLIQGLLFGVSAHDPTTIAGVAALLAFITLLASWIPARRATKVDPMIALRYE